MRFSKRRSCAVVFAHYLPIGVAATASHAPIQSSLTTIMRCGVHALYANRGCGDCEPCANLGLFLRFQNRHGEDTLYTNPCHSSCKACASPIFGDLFCTPTCLHIVRHQGCARGEPCASMHEYVFKPVCTHLRLQAVR